MEASNWYRYMQTELQQTTLFSDVVMKNMPDPFEAKRDIWIPFIKDELIAPYDSSNTIVIGHSSGAVAAMRLLEDTKLLGCVLVSACHTDLGEPNEKISGYYPGFRNGNEEANPWLFDKMKENSEWILQYHSTDDPFIPRHEADFVSRRAPWRALFPSSDPRQQAVRPPNRLAIAWSRATRSRMCRRARVIVTS